MKKLITVLVFSGLLTVPSVVFAEANWYGSLRGGVELGGGEDARFADQGSRWGIRGSNEVSEGLSANYRFEHKFSTSDAGMPGGRLAYVGLTGGFGTVSLGQIWSASYNAIGGLSDPAWVKSDTQTSYRVGNALSYAVSAGSVSMQVDAIMDGGKETDSAIDQLEFGLTFNVTDNISLAVAHTNKKDLEKITMTTTYHLDDADKTEVEMIMVKVDSAGSLTDAQLGGITVNEGVYSVGTNTCDDSDTDATNDCVDQVAYVKRTPTSPVGSSTNPEMVPTGNSEMYYASAMEKVTITGVGSKANHFAIQMALGGLSAYVTHSQTEMNNSSDKSKATRYGVSGGIGDGGLSFYVMARSLDPAGDMKSTPWLAGITKALGSGASAFAEYHDPDNGGSGISNFGLVVNF